MKSPEEILAEETLKIILRGVIDAGRSGGQWVWRHIRGPLELPGERKEILSDLLLGRGDFLFHPSTDWRPAPGESEPPRTPRGYPHDLHALWSFQSILPSPKHLQDRIYFEGKVAPTSRIVCSGSPKANAFSRKYLPSYVATADAVTQQYPSFLDPQKIPYLYGEDLASPRVKVVSKMRGGAESLKMRKMLWVRHSGEIRPWYPKGSHDQEWLMRDFLLVSRLPRTSVGGDVLVISGGHGAGTEAISLMMQKLHIMELRILSDAIGGAPYYQFVLEVTKIKHTKEGTTAHALKLSDELPPVKLELDAGTLFPYLVRDKKELR